MLGPRTQHKGTVCQNSGRPLVIALVGRRLARSRRFALRRSNLGIGMAHKWGTSTKVGDSFPNKAVDIGFVGLDPANRKMCARPLPRRRTPHRRSFARTLQPSRSSSRPPPPRSSLRAPLSSPPTRARPRSGDLNKGKILWVTLPGAFTPT